MAKGKIKLTELQRYKLEQASNLVGEVHGELDGGDEFKGEAKTSMDVLGKTCRYVRAASIIGTDEFCEAAEELEPEKTDVDDDDEDGDETQN